MSRPATLASTSVGIGLRARHYREVVAGGAQAVGPVGFLEVHSENFFAEGGAGQQVLQQAREQFPISLHGVGLGLGNAHGLSPEHLRKLRDLVCWAQPALVSEHVCWTALLQADGTELAFNDLLPLPYTRETLDLLCTHIEQVQDWLGRRVLIENATAYVQFAASDIHEIDFIAEAARRTGCGVLLDVNNLYVNSINHGFDALAALARMPQGLVGEYHLAGHLRTDDGLIDDHGSLVVPAVWDLYRVALSQLGPSPTLIEWDTDVPALDVLVAEAQRAHDCMQECSREAQVCHA
jgi:uncharacterized protein (UPF0276 family)